MPSRPAPTARSDPEGYLALCKFSLKLPKCPRSGLPVSYCDIGDPNGIPLLWVLPSGCSRWFAASQDPVAKKYGVRVIAVDRPGVGGTPMVPLKSRIATSCDMMQTVIEHLGIKLSYVLGTSAGIYYVLHLLTYNSAIFSHGLPPKVFLVSPWSPLLPPDDPDYYSSFFEWIPSKVIETQHVTLPALMTMAKSASSIWDMSRTALWGGVSIAKSFISDTLGSGAGSASSTSSSGSGEHPRTDVHVNPEGAPVVQQVESTLEVKAAGETLVEDEDSRFWGDCPCCIGCLMEEYFGLENAGGVGQEHLQCLNRGPVDTGPKWFQKSIADLASVLQTRESSAGNDGRLKIHVWWGWEDTMVPRKGQLWFNKTMMGYPDQITLVIHDIPDGDHTDLLGRVDGIHKIYGMMWEEAGKEDR